MWRIHQKDCRLIMILLVISQPSVQALHMLENECEGGESIIVDGWELLEDLRKDKPEFFNILKEFQVPFREFDENNETYAEAPLIQCSSNGSIESFRFSNQLMQMINPTKKGIKKFYKAYHELSTEYLTPSIALHLGCMEERYL